jgi:hypothetical protein
MHFVISYGPPNCLWDQIVAIIVHFLISLTRAFCLQWLTSTLVNQVPIDCLQVRSKNATRTV